MNKIYFSSLLLSTMFLSCGGKEEKLATAPVQSIPTVDVVQLKAGQVANQIEIPGTIIPGEEVIIVSETMGKVEKIGFKESQIVTKGMVLFQLDTDILSAEKAGLLVDLKVAQKEENRKKSLLQIKGISEEDYDRAEAEVNRIKAKLELIQTQLEKATIRAPFSGRIGLRKVSIGSIVQPNTPLTTLVQENPIKVEFSVSERYANAVKTGQSIQLTLPNSSRTFTAKVYAYESKVDAGTRMLTVRGELKNTGQLIAGTLVNVKYELGFEEHAFMVPAESIIPILNGQKVFVARNNTVVEIPVSIGIRTEKEVQIMGDLRENDLVLTTGLLAVKAGSPVKTSRVNS